MRVTILLTITLLMCSSFVSAELLSLEKLQDFTEKFGADTSPPHFYVKHPISKHRLSEISEIKEKIIYPLVNKNPYPISVIIIEFRREVDDVNYAAASPALLAFAGSGVRCVFKRKRLSKPGTLSGLLWRLSNLPSTAISMSVRRNPMSSSR